MVYITTEKFLSPWVPDILIRNVFAVLRHVFYFNTNEEDPHVVIR